MNWFWMTFFLICALVGHTLAKLDYEQAKKAPNCKCPENQLNCKCFRMRPNTTSTRSAKSLMREMTHTFPRTTEMPTTEFPVTSTTETRTTTTTEVPHVSTDFQSVISDVTPQPLHFEPNNPAVTQQQIAEPYSPKSQHSAYQQFPQIGQRQQQQIGTFQFPKYPEFQQRNNFPQMRNAYQNDNAGGTFPNNVKTAFSYSNAGNSNAHTAFTYSNAGKTFPNNNVNMAYNNAGGNFPGFNGNNFRNFVPQNPFFRFKKKKR